MIEKRARKISRKLGKLLEEISEELDELNEYEAKDIAAKKSNK